MKVALLWVRKRICLHIGQNNCLIAEKEFIRIAHLDWYIKELLIWNCIKVDAWISFDCEKG